jgi:hypothetical protein
MTTAGDVCFVCGGDGRYANAFGRVSSCPGCRGSGRRAESDVGMRDVTKTKASHHAPRAPAGKQTWPSTLEGAQLAKEVQESATLGTEVKSRLIAEIIDHEGSHGRCTQTFVKKVRKQVK